MKKQSHYRTSGVRRRTLRISRGLIAAALVATSASFAVATSPAGTAHAASTLFAAGVPQRIWDTRPPSGDLSTGALGDGQVIVINVGTSRPVVLNLAAVLPTASGHLTGYPCGNARPDTSVLNFVAGVTSNLAVVTPNGFGQVCLAASVEGRGSVHVVVDKYGALNGSAFQSQTATRRLDTRPSGAKVDANTVRSIGGNAPHTVVALNLTATEAEAAGWLSVYPCSEGFGGAATLNFSAGETRATLAIARADAAGAVCIQSSVRTHIVADQMGVFQSSPDADIITPARIMNTRTNFAGRYGHQFSLDFDSIASDRGTVFKGRGRAVLLNVVAVSPAAQGHLVVWPCASPRPDTSVLNFDSSAYATSNAVVVQPDSSGRVCMWSPTPTDLVVDIAGFLNTSAPGSSSGYEPRTDCTRGSLDFMNVARARTGRQPLSWNEAQFAYACAWAHRVATNQQLSHWSWGAAPSRGENVAVNSSIGVIESRWLASPPHYNNVIGPNYASASVAYVDTIITGRKVVWGVTEFA